jgi:hypothetical protein
VLRSRSAGSDMVRDRVSGRLESFVAALAAIWAAYGGKEIVSLASGPHMMYKSVLRGGALWRRVLCV